MKKELWKLLKEELEKDREKTILEINKLCSLNIEDKKDYTNLSLEEKIKMFTGNSVYEFLKQENVIDFKDLNITPEQIQLLFIVIKTNILGENYIKQKLLLEIWNEEREEFGGFRDVDYNITINFTKPTTLQE